MEDEDNQKIGLSKGINFPLSDIQGLNTQFVECAEILGKNIISSGLIPDYSKFTIDLVNNIIPILESFSKTFEKHKPFFDKLAKLGFSYKEVDQLLGHYNWVISPSLPPRLAINVFEICKSDTIPNRQKRYKINDLFVSYFKYNNYSNLKLMIGYWEDNSLFKKRMKILKDCYWIMKNKQSSFNPSNLVITTLISQIDGITADYFESKGFSVKRTTWYDTNMNKIGSPSICISKEICNSPSFMQSYTNLLLDKLFETTFRGQPTSLVFNRHKILHGEKINYGRIDNAIRAFLVLDLLSDIR